MPRKWTIIVSIDSMEYHEPWPGLRQFCNAYKLSYNTLKQKKFPFNYRGMTFRKQLDGQKSKVFEIQSKKTFTKSKKK